MKDATFCPVCGSSTKRENCARCCPRPIVATRFSYTHSRLKRMFPSTAFDPVHRLYLISERDVARYWPEFARLEAREVRHPPYPCER